MRLGTTLRPLLTLDHGSEALREQLAKIILMRDAERRLVTGRFQDVDVCYWEALS